jgi:protein-S-isoprenylcysteine O-methyltransferase Ste14
MEWFKYVDVPVFLVLAVFVVVRGSHTAWYFFGLALAAVAFVLWMIARYQLGSSFSVRARARRLVTTGLYSKFRHPIYLFALFAFAGLFIAWRAWILLLAYLASTIAGQLGRARREEAVLEAAFGDDYRRWKAQTWI